MMNKDEAVQKLAKVGGVLNSPRCLEVTDE